MSEKILFVDDEQNILSGFERSFRKDFNLDTAITGMEGISAIKLHGPYAVVVSDMRMPGMDGIQFLSRVKEISPDTVRIMLTGNADIQTAIDAVNEGNIFRFLNKPCPTELMLQTLQAALEQYRLIRAEKDLLEKTLNGSIQMLTEILAMLNPTAFGRANRVRHLVRQIANELTVPNGWQVELAAMLSQIGFITIPEETLCKVYKGQSLSIEEYRLLQSHPQVGRDLVSLIPRLEPVAKIIAYQEKHYDGGGSPQDNVKGDEIPLGARILHAALDFDKLIEGKMGHIEAIEELEKRNNRYDPNVIQSLKLTIQPTIHFETKQVRLSELRPGMKIGQEITTTFGYPLVDIGHVVTAAFCVRLRNFVESGMINEPFTVQVPVKAPDKMKEDPNL